MHLYLRWRKRSKIIGAIFLSAFLLIGFQNFTYETLDIYISATGGSNANNGESYDQAVRTFDRAQEILKAKHALEPITRPIRILVGKGEYHCRGLQSTWTFSNGQPITIQPLHRVNRSNSFDADLNRPIFKGKDADGKNCNNGVWFVVEHSGQAMNLTIKGLKVVDYRGGITIRAAKGIIPTRFQNIVIQNMIFERIGDTYYQTNIAGKGAILVSYTKKVDILDSYFKEIRNAALPGLIHSIYFSSHASGSFINGNYFIGNSGSAIKLTNNSNYNVFANNYFSSMPTAIVDRWCGASKDDNIELQCPGGVAQCPSWENDFSNGNVVENITFNKNAVVYPIPYSQDCGRKPPRAKVRMYF